MTTQTHQDRPSQPSGHPGWYPGWRQAAAGLARPRPQSGRGKDNENKKKKGGQQVHCYFSKYIYITKTITIHSSFHKQHFRTFPPAQLSFYISMHLLFLFHPSILTHLAADAVEGLLQKISRRCGGRRNDLPTSFCVGCAELRWTRQRDEGRGEGGGRRD